MAATSAAMTWWGLLQAKARVKPAGWQDFLRQEGPLEARDKRGRDAL
jgi:hypothetical protein